MNNKYSEKDFQKFPINVLVKHAKFFKNFKEFSTYFSIKIGHGYYWHLTDNPNFEISDKTGPRDMSSMSNGKIDGYGDLMITSDLEYWDEHYNTDRDTWKRNIIRPYVVLFNPINIEPNKLEQVGRGFGNEVYLKKEDAAKLIQVGVYNLKYAKALDRKFHNLIPNSESQLKEIYDYAWNVINNDSIIDEELTAYHGTPYDFDSFSTDKIGTGEGNQTFGWGLYFTDKKEIAQQYAEQIKKRINSRLNDINNNIRNKIFSKLYKNFIGIEQLYPQHKRLINNIQDSLLNNIDDEIEKAYVNRNSDLSINIDDKVIIELINDLKQIIEFKKSIQLKNYLRLKKEFNKRKHEKVDSITNTFIEDRLKESEEVFNIYNILLKNITYKRFKKFLYELNLEDSKYRPKNILYNSYLYTLKIHKGKTPDQYNWLDWYEPISDKTLEVFQKFIKEKNIKLSSSNDEDKPEDRITGIKLYKWMSSQLGSPKEASLFLLKNGIDGIRYPSGTLSGIKDSDYYNYVVFDPKAVEIENKEKLNEMLEYTDNKQKEIQNLIDNAEYKLDIKHNTSSDGVEIYVLRLSHEDSKEKIAIMKFFVYKDRAEVDDIEVNRYSYRRRHGIATYLYLQAKKICNKYNVNLYASNNRTVSGKELWNSFLKRGIAKSDNNNLYIEQLTEEVKSTSAIVYHRTKKEYIPNFEFGDGDTYGRGFYSTYDLDSQLRDNMLRYGKNIMQFQVQIRDFLILDKAEAIKVYGEYNIKKQLIKLAPKIYILHKNFIDDLLINSRDYEYTSDLAKTLVDEIKINKYIKGMIFTGRQDGKVLVCYDKTLIKQIKISKDNGQTWSNVIDKNIYTTNKQIKTNDITEDEKLDLTLKQISKIPLDKKIPIVKTLFDKYQKTFVFNIINTGNHIFFYMLNDNQRVQFIKLMEPSEPSGHKREFYLSVMYTYLRNDNNPNFNLTKNLVNFFVEQIMYTGDYHLMSETFFIPDYFKKIIPVLDVKNKVNLLWYVLNTFNYDSDVKNIYKELFTKDNIINFLQKYGDKIIYNDWTGDNVIDQLKKLVGKEEVDDDITTLKESALNGDNIYDSDLLSKMYDIFAKSYKDKTGNTFTKDTFISKARNWKFFGTTEGFIAVRMQNSGLVKLTAAAGSPFGVVKGLQQIQALNKPVWGAVDENLLNMFNGKFGFKRPNKFLFWALSKVIDPKSLGVSNVRFENGKVIVNYPDIGEKTKYIIGNDMYFDFLTSEAKKRTIGKLFK